MQMLWLPVLCLFLLLCRRIDSQVCRRQLFLQTNQTVTITSVNYPGYFSSGNACSYQLKAPVNHEIQVTCSFEVYPNVCRSSFLFVSRDGDVTFTGADRFCTTTHVTIKSNFQSLALGYRADYTLATQQARLSCQAVARRVRCNCGWSQTTRIANGVQASKHEFPSMVAIRDLSSNLPILCGGSIVSDRYIVTAAHCTRRQPNAQRLVARVGSNDISQPGDSIFASEYAIQRIIENPGYSSTTNANDIALLQTVRTIEWSRGVGPICLPLRQGSGDISNLPVYIAGWGTLGFLNPISRTLQKAQLLTTTNAHCSREFNVTLLSSQVCTYDYSGLGRDSCQYDSGGPIIRVIQNRLFLLGVISYGRQCGLRYNTGVNTRVSSYNNWILGHVGGSVCVW
ncbi:hypothetical protein KR222_009199 [Zaprionus bogoriensis]|nr:hypothetical protein KR222_009199 [Zaprionus bogoriensis]